MIQAPKLIEVRDTAGGMSTFHVYETEAVVSGIKDVSRDGHDRIVEIEDGRWYLEADTKVDDDSRFFPVIVHRWEW